MKDLTIKICGEVNSGKSIMQYLLINELRRQGMNVEFIPDVDFPTEESLQIHFDKCLDEIKIHEYNVKVETVQLNREPLHFTREQYAAAAKAANIKILNGPSDDWMKSQIEKINSEPRQDLPHTIAMDFMYDVPYEKIRNEMTDLKNNPEIY